MRLFQTFDEAVIEIRRDLSKAPEVKSTRVQQWQLEKWANEAQNYIYAVMPGGIPTGITGFMDMMVPHFPYYAEHREAISNWLARQQGERLYAGKDYHIIGEPSDAIHPALGQAKEGEHYSYTYRERMVGAFDHMAAVLRRNPDSRRAFWPVFRELDAIRAAQDTRVPCTLGYHAMIRNVPGGASSPDLPATKRGLRDLLPNGCLPGSHLPSGAGQNP